MEMRKCVEGIAEKLVNIICYPVEVGPISTWYIQPKPEKALF